MNSSGAARLTDRENEVLLLVASGRTAARIGRELRISERTVHKHLENVYLKLGVHDRISAVLQVMSPPPE
jgi:DNA-binding CsgD family transcriptional regulator